jgi:flavin reductase (DIM6/NTAB) family NADH-FMN oxidoreductase RutF
MGLVHAFEEAGDLFLRYRRAEVGGWGSDEAAASSRSAPPDDPPDSPDSVEAFHEVMAGIDFPMVIVTAADGDDRSGCLVGFHAQSSIDPPRFTVWISKMNHTYAVARRAEVLTVHLPAADQRALAALFGEETGDEIDKFARCSWRVGPRGAAVLDDVARWFVGRVTETLDSGDHVAFLLEPVAGAAGPWSGQLSFQSVKDFEPGHDA